MNSLLLILLLIQVTFSAQASSFHKPKVYWNLPTERCKDDNNQPMIELEINGIIQNERQIFFGEEIGIVYIDEMEQMPMISLHNHTDTRAGGIPQMINRTDYLAALEEFVAERIPNTSFDGVAILDLEVFRPDWDLHWGRLSVYRNRSVQHVLSRNNSSGFNETEVEKLAKKEFNEAVRWIFTETIRLCRRMRPSGIWGYYYYPFMHMDKETREGKTGIIQINNNLDWLWKQSNAIFPSFYFGDQITQKENRFENVKMIMAEANRISRLYNIPVYSYTTFEYNAYNKSMMFDYYDKADICQSIKTLVDMGSEGIIIWGTKKRMEERCRNIANYVNNQLGRSVKIILDQHQKCREKRCNNHGRCVLKARHAEKSCTMLETKNRRHRFKCVCDPEYTGPFCSKRANSK